MSYTEKQKSEYVRELQKYLFHIAQKDKRIPAPSPDGVYGPETEAAVTAFQRHYSLSITGEVDKPTWDAIALEYHQSFGLNPIAIDVFPHGDYVMVPGDSGNLVLQLQLMLFVFAGAYSNMIEPEQNGIYGKETEMAVKSLQAVSMLPQTGEVDVQTWNRLSRWFSSYLKG